MGRRARINVPVDAYEDALDTSLRIKSDTVSVDQRGYSDLVAEELGQDYLGSRFIVFDELQLGADASYQLPDLLMVELSDNQAFRAAVREFGPVGLNYSINIEDEITVTADYDPAYSSDAFMEAKEFYDDFTELDADTLTDTEHVASLMDLTEDMPSYVVEKHMLADPAATFSTDRLILEEPGHTTYLFQMDDVYAVSIGTKTQPLEELTEGYWKKKSLTEPLARLYIAGDIRRSASKTNKLKDVIAERTLETIMEACDARENALFGGGAETLDSLLQLDIEEIVPDEYHALTELEESTNISLDTDADHVKLTVMDGQKQFFADLMNDLQAAYIYDEPFAARTHGEYAVGVEDLQESYQAWTDSDLQYLPGEYAPSEGYAADTINAFCAETALSGDDGIFLSYLINNMADDEIILEDVDGLNYLGYRLSGKHVTVQADVGDWLGGRMEDGVIEVTGDAQLLVGSRATGGEIYLHNDGESLNTDADIYRKQRMRSLFHWKDQWTKIA